MNPLNPLNVLAFFSLGSQELMVVVFLAFLLFGAKKIPELMRSLGRAQGEFQHAKKAFDSEVAGKTKDDAGQGTAASSPSPDATDAARMAGARAEAEALGIDATGKDLDTLRAEIDAKNEA